MCGVNGISDCFLVVAMGDSDGATQEKGHQYGIFWLQQNTFPSVSQVM